MGLNKYPPIFNSKETHITIESCVLLLNLTKEYNTLSKQNIKAKKPTNPK